MLREKTKTKSEKLREKDNYIGMHICGQVNSRKKKGAHINVTIERFHSKLSEALYFVLVGKQSETFHVKFEVMLVIIDTKF